MQEINNFINTTAYPESKTPRQVLIPEPFSESEVKTQLKTQSSDKDNATPTEELQYPTPIPMTIYDPPPAPQKSSK